MTTRNFMQLLQANQDEGKFVCVGLDSDINKLPQYLVKMLGLTEAQLIFNETIVSATCEVAGAYKPNLAFYRGTDGKAVLRQTIEYIQLMAPGVPVILDAKQGDIGNTNDGYMDDDFEYYDADAVTVHNYMGMEAMKPFLNQVDKGVIVLVRTSNPGAGEFQDLPVPVNYDTAVEMGFGAAEAAYRNGLNDRSATVPLYLFIAGSVAHRWNSNNNCCVVVGATAPAELVEVRRVVGDMPILLPGIGAQGGKMEPVLDAGRNSLGQGMIINNSRGIIFDSWGEGTNFTDQQFADAAAAATLAMHNAIRSHLGLAV